MSQFTVLGARGLIGSRLAASLARDGHEVCTPLRDDDLTSRSLGHVIYAIGLTSDFRTRTFDTITANALPAIHPHCSNYFIAGQCTLHAMASIPFL